MGHKTQNSKETNATGKECPLKMVSPKPSFTAEGTTQDAASKTDGTLSVLWHHWELPNARACLPIRRESLAVLVRSKKQQECHALGEVPQNPEHLPVATTQDRSAYLNPYLLGCTVMRWERVALNNRGTG